MQSWYDSGLRLDGVVAPTAAPEPEPVVEMAAEVAAPEPAPAAAAARLEASWNPKGLDVSAIPADVPGVSLFKEQFISENLNSAPAYLDGSMPGDKGFDPWGLIALAKPSLEMDKTSRTGAERDTTIESMSEEERASALAWMRNSELKHARLAMLATLGWVAAEKLNAKALYFTTNGKAPSLFNGHLTDYAPFLIVFLGANWKCKIERRAAAVALCAALVSKAALFPSDVEIVLFVPVLLIDACCRALGSCPRFSVGAQNVWDAGPMGAHTQAARRRAC